MRTDEEIAQRIREVREKDMFGWETGGLALYLPREKLGTLGFKINEELPWEPKARDRESVVAAIGEYMPFAVDKVMNHRGLSAERSVGHFRTWTWLLGDSEFAAIDWDIYSRYGVPILLRVMQEYGLPQPEDPKFFRMARGEPCVEVCHEGCLI